MGRRAKQSAPLGPRASRVEKTRAPRARRLPDWYYRVLRLRWDQELFGPKDSGDFDEDLSELEESKEEDEDCECDGEDPECDCRYDESERSYDGSDADYYYSLKEEREERKRENLVERLDKERHLKFEKSKEEEVQAAETSLRKAQKKGRISLGNPKSLAGQEFRLFCSDHVDHFYYYGSYEDKSVRFIHPDNMPADNGLDDPDVKSGDDAGMLYGSLYLDMDSACKFGPFFPPSNATFRPVKVESCDGKYKLSLDFLGNGYLKLRVSRDVVFMGWNDESPAACPPNAPAPEVFEFVGIWVEKEKEKEKEQARREDMEMERERLEWQRRSPSPRESWFELNHPMGAYYDPRYAVDW